MLTTIPHDSLGADAYEYDVERSRFICSLKRVSTEAEARDFVESVKKEHYKANHSCSAYVVGYPPEEFSADLTADLPQQTEHSSDDGEPSGTAGLPMLEVLRKRQVTNLVAVVTRYFGGIKLGAGGLIRAYSGTVATALDRVGLNQMVERQAIHCDLPYSLYDPFLRFVTDFAEASPGQADFGEAVTAEVFVTATKVADFTAALVNAFNDAISAEPGARSLVEVPASAAVSD